MATTRGGNVDVREIPAEKLNVKQFIVEQVESLKQTVGNGLAVNALSGGVDSSVVTMLAHRALGDRLRTFFICNGIMRDGEPEYVVGVFEKLGVKVEMVHAEDAFFAALRGLTDPEEKREAITQTFYKNVFGRLVRESGAKYLLQGTNWTDVEETVAGVKRQHNILEQLGIDTQREFGYKVLEPVLQLRKTGIRMVGKAIGLPEEIYSRPPFPGPALAARVIGEVTPERVAVVRKATVIVEQELKKSGAFQYLAILHNDKVTGMRNGKRDYGLQIEVRCWESKDAITGTPTRLSWDVLEKLASRITEEVPGVVSVTYGIARKPPSTIEVV
jgi:GMP synthase (glutamine-hydrolysing)